MKRRWVILISVALVVVVGTFALRHASQGVHAGDTYQVSLTRHGCAQADPLYLDGWAWEGGFPLEYGDGPIPGTLRVDSVERWTATFKADTGWSTPLRGNPDGFSDLNCSVYG